jgi:hypothetical protein
VTKAILESGPRTAVAVCIGPTGLVFAYGPLKSRPIWELVEAGVVPKLVPCPVRNPVGYVAWVRSN